MARGRRPSWGLRAEEEFLAIPPLVGRDGCQMFRTPLTLGQPPTALELEESL